MPPGFHGQDLIRVFNVNQNTDPGFDPADYRPQLRCSPNGHRLHIPRRIPAVFHVRCNRSGPQRLPRRSILPLWRPWSEEHIEIKFGQSETEDGVFVKPFATDQGVLERCEYVAIY